MENNRRNYSGGAIGIESYNCRNRFVAEYASGIVCDVVWIDPAFFADYGILSILFREKRQKKDSMLCPTHIRNPFVTCMHGCTNNSYSPRPT